jgi:MFS transporter, PPP family, 3-phenylpropionic acid transporter
MASRRDTVLPLLALYSVFYMGIAVSMIYLPVLLGRQGHDERSIGTILTAGPFIGLLAQPVWGVIADRARSKNRVLALLLIGSALSFALFLVVPSSFVSAVAVMALFAFFQMSGMPLLDTIALERLDAEGRGFGPVRMAGTIGYMLAVLGAGYAVARIPAASVWLYCALALAAAGVVLLMPQVAGHAGRGGRVSPLRLLRDGRLVILLVVATIGGTTFFANYSFFPLYVEELGGDATVVGWAAFAAAALEIPMLLAADRIHRRIGSEAMVIIALAAAALRWLLQAGVREPWALVPVQLLHGLSMVVITFALARYIAYAVAPELRASGQALAGASFGGVARIAGTFGGGLAASGLGLKQMYVGGAALAAACAVALATATLLRRVHSGDSPR